MLLCCRKTHYLTLPYQQHVFSFTVHEQTMAVLLLYERQRLKRTINATINYSGNNIINTGRSSTNEGGLIAHKTTRPHAQCHDIATQPSVRRSTATGARPRGGGTARLSLPCITTGHFIPDQTHPVSSHLIELYQLLRRVRMRRVVGGAVGPELLHRPTRPRRL